MLASGLRIIFQTLMASLPAHIRFPALLPPLIYLTPKKMKIKSNAEDKERCVHLGEQHDSLLRRRVGSDDESGAGFQVVLQTVRHLSIDPDVSVLRHDPAHGRAHRGVFRDREGVQVCRGRKNITPR